MMSSFGPIVALDNPGSTLQNTFAAGNRVLDILDEQPVTKDITGCEEVEFNCAATENVTFSYGEETIISDVSIPVLKGSIIGISGRSGSGKSTIAKLDATDEKIIEACKKASVPISYQSFLMDTTLMSVNWEICYQAERSRESGLLKHFT